MVQGLRPNRRAIFVGLGGIAAAGAGLSIFGREMIWQVAAGPPAERQLSAPEAHAAALSGEIVLIDIRRPEEWAASGSGEGAVRLDMRREDFTERLMDLTNGATDTPIAVICARGVRSARMSARLTEAGFTHIIDVPEGMFGSAAGPGWIGRGLPVDRS